MTLHAYLSGALAALSVVAALFFARYWRVSGDRFFLFFAGAFLVLAVNWSAIAAATPAAEGYYWVYLIRLAAFLLILAAILDKNRSERR